MKTRFLLLPALLATSIAQANTPVDQLPDTLVTASRVEQPRSAALAANTVFTRSDIERLQARSVPELLSRVPGLQQNRNGGIPSYFLRGTNTNQTLVLVDGQRIASTTAGIARIDYLNIDNVERVEVIRGPRSSVFGADAIGGVIQIFTRQPEPGLQPTVRLGMATEHTREHSVSLMGGNQDTRFALGASLDETHGFDRTTDQVGNDSDRDASRNKALYLNVTHALNADWQTGLSLNDQRGKNEFDDAFDLVPGNPEDQFRVSSYQAHLQGQLSQVWSSRLELGRSFDRNKTVGSGSPWNDGSIETTRHSASWLNQLTLSPEHDLTLGSDWHKDRLSSTNAYSKTSRENWAVFAQHRWTTDQFSTEVGVRHDDNQHFGTESSFNAALAIPVGDWQQWILSYSEGFRAPTFNDLYAPPGWGGNPNLNAETSKNWELQWRGQLAQADIEAALFHNTIDDLIAWNPSTSQVENINRARIQGAEAAINTTLLGWNSRTAITLIDPRDRDTGHTLQLRAKRSISQDLDRQFGDIGIGATWQAFSQRFRNPSNDGTLSGYATLDLRGSWQASQSLRWELKVQNLFDRDYALGTYSRPTGPWPAPSLTLPYAQPGRTALLAVTWTPHL
ncbi:TonB-dependent receptor domain-containing protein [Halopseudomonas salegens]|uniref:Vitamin B12 transporter n=1 Tax=Halopseudomonas salegens TaxID=1434072 RepID=A0A1H2DYM5_9GAMM|nr:TonB-dependent receptor [Halopseudomonas salegens]SDT87905.1 vitamin B12 transporter [Halopseudomonas salegens]